MDSKPSRAIVVGLLMVVACDSPPKADASRTASEKWAEPTAHAEGNEGADAKGAERAGAEGANAAAGGDAAGAKAEAEAAEAVAEAGAAEAGTAEGGEDPVLPPAGDPGPAYVAIDDKGVFVVEGGAITAIDKVPRARLRDLQLGPDGAPWLLAGDDVLRIEGGVAKVVATASFDETGNVEAFAVGGDGHVWTVGFKGVAHWDGKAWTLDEKAQLGADVTLLRGVAIDSAGRPWVASSHALHVEDAEAWTQVDLGGLPVERPLFDALVTHPSTGSIVAVASSIVLQVTGPDAVQELPVRSEGSSYFGAIAFAHNGIGALVTDAGHVARFVDGAITRYALGKDFTGSRVHHLAVDGQGRVWITTDAGIAVVGPAEQRVEWKSGSIPELAGRIEALVVVGAGPQLPEAGEVQTGTLKGRILIDGAPLADADIELCPAPATLIKKSPCEDSPVRFSGKTGADGGFSFADTPLGAYGIAVRVGQKWKSTLAGQYGAQMKPGQTHDIGTLKFKK